MAQSKNVKSFTGIVKSAKTDKTIVVIVQTRKTHPIYRKQYTDSRNFMAHDEKNEAEVGDIVRIVETRPLSAQKHFKLDKIIEKPTLRQADKAVAEAEPVAEEQEEGEEKA